jgi:hypothetical protein
MDERLVSDEKTSAVEGAHHFSSAIMTSISAADASSGSFRKRLTSPAIAAVRKECHAFGQGKLALHSEL